MIYPFLIPIVGIIAAVIMVIGIPLARAYARRIEGVPHDVPPELNARLAQMQQAIDAIAVEVERISEGQRFTTKLLAERSTASAPSWATEPAVGEETRRP
jgi:hypothetical protein